MPQAASRDCEAGDASAGGLVRRVYLDSGSVIFEQLDARSGIEIAPLESEFGSRHHELSREVVDVSVSSQKQEPWAMLRAIMIWVVFKLVEFGTLFCCLVIGNVTWVLFEELSFEQVFTALAQEWWVVVFLALVGVVYYFSVLGYIPFSFVAFVVERRLVRTSFRASSVNFFIFLLHSSVVFTLYSIWDERFIRSYIILSWPLGLILIYYVCRRVEQFAGSL